MFRSALTRIIAAVVATVALVFGFSSAAWASPGIIATFPVSGSTVALTYSPDGSTIYVMRQTPTKAVIVLDANTNQIFSTIDLSSLTGVISHIAISPDGNTLYVLEGYSDFTTPHHLDAIDLVASPPAITSSMDLSTDASNFVISTDGTKAYVANYYVATVSIVSLSTMTVTSEIGPFAATGLTPATNYTSPSDMLVSPTGNYVYLGFYKASAATGAAGVVTISTTSDTAVSDLPLSASRNDESTHVYYMTIASDGSSIWIGNLKNSNAWVKRFSVSSGVLSTTTTTIPGPAGIGSGYPLGLAVSHDGTILFVAYSYGFNRVYMYNTASTDGSPSAYVDGIATAFSLVTPPTNGLAFAYASSGSNNFYEIGIGLSPLKQSVSIKPGDAVNSMPMTALLAGSGAVTYSLSGALPAGLEFDSTTGVISGVPTEEWPETTYTITASNGSDPDLTATFILTVSNNPAPSPNLPDTGFSGESGAHVAAVLLGLGVLGAIALILRRRITR